MSQRDVVIVGAGAAGIAAARALRAHGYSPLVVEARDRVGGRAWTDTRTFGVPIDMGCAWLHCADINPWTPYARSNGFTVLQRDPQWQRRIGREVASAEYQASWLAAWERNERLIEDAAKVSHDVAVSDVIPHDRHYPLFDAIMGWLMGANAQFVSTVDFARYRDTNANWAVVQGLGSVVAHAARELDVKLSTRVTKLEAASSAARVHTTSGVIECDAVIVTIPTSLMATLTFEPALPMSFLDALAGVPMGIANKVFYQLKPGTLPFEGMMHFTGTNESARTASYGVRPNSQELLLAYFGGTLARELEETGELDAFARDELGRIFGREFLGNIVAMHSTAWATDPFSLGAYSAALPGHGRDREILREPPMERVLYAGEATSLEHFGTIHGAWHSGVRAAELAGRYVMPR